MAKKNLSSNFVRAAEELLESHGYTKHSSPKIEAPIHSKWRTPDGDVRFLHAALHDVLSDHFCTDKG